MNSTATRSGTIFRLSLCLLLSVSTWRGPVPILHCHDGITDAELLLHHESVCHSSDHADDHHGFHWHLAFPEDVAGNRCPDSDLTVPEFAVFACAHAMHCSELTELRATTFADSCLSFLPENAAGRFRTRLNRKYGNARSFLESLSRHMPLVAITGDCRV